MEVAHPGWDKIRYKKTRFKKILRIMLIINDISCKRLLVAKIHRNRGLITSAYSSIIKLALGKIEC